jgi:hypothetical protein
MSIANVSYGVVTITDCDQNIVLYDLHELNFTVRPTNQVETLV